MLLPIAEQPVPGVEIVFVGGISPWGVRVGPDAISVGQGYDTQFYTCPTDRATGVVCVDGVWHWEFPQVAERV